MASYLKKDVLNNLKERDYKDQNRAEGPLRKAEDAIELDNSRITIEQQMQWLLDKFDRVIENEK